MRRDVNISIIFHEIFCSYMDQQHLTPKLHMSLFSHFKNLVTLKTTFKQSVVVQSNFCNQNQK